MSAKLLHLDVFLLPHYVGHNADRMWVNGEHAGTEQDVFNVYVWLVRKKKLILLLRFIPALHIIARHQILLLHIMRSIKRTSKGNSFN